MAKNLVNYEEVDVLIRELDQIATNLEGSVKIAISNTDALLSETNAIYLTEVNNTNRQLLKCDADCVEAVQDVLRAYRRYEEEHRALAERL